LLYHEKFNIYVANNPIPTSGTIKMYPQRRYIETIRWAKSHFPVDATRVYTKGNSQSGHGAQLTAAMIPEEITAVYSVCEPMSLVTGGKSILRQMWVIIFRSETDFLDWKTGQPLGFYKLSDMRDMVNTNELLDVPLVFDVHEKMILPSPGRKPK
jgi:hypothetical protein